MAWQRMLIPLVGVPEPIEVQTNALDWRRVRIDVDAPIDGLWQACHNALLRTGADVPKDYEAFLADALDGMPEVADGDGVAPLDPTTAGP